tara:strand:+ start:73 stop:396 length:324 start_codon:yes stop_codon:yes gene_type:complete
MAFIGELAALSWVNFHAVSSVGIRDDYNVSSITDNGTGDFWVNFTNNMANTTYCALGTVAESSSDPNRYASLFHSFATNRYRVCSNFPSHTREDCELYCYAVFGDPT